MIVGAGGFQWAPSMHTLHTAAPSVNSSQVMSRRRTACPLLPPPCAPCVMITDPMIKPHDTSSLAIDPRPSLPPSCPRPCRPQVSVAAASHLGHPAPQSGETVIATDAPAMRTVLAAAQGNAVLNG